MLWEYKLGVNTRGIVKDAKESDSHYYSTISYHLTMAILRSLFLISSDVFVDIGCGKGRVLCCASRFGIRKVIGVEIDKDLCDIAECNAKKVHGRKSIIEIFNVSAEDFDYRTGTVYYLFNPFGVSTLSSVLTRMERSLRLQPRKLTIVYVNSVHDSLLSKSGWLEMYSKWEAGDKFGLMHNVSFWRSKD
jgi:predicted RNA methylase